MIEQGEIVERDEPTETFVRAVGPKPDAADEQAVSAQQLPDVEPVLTAAPDEPLDEEG